MLWLASLGDAFSNKVVGWDTAARADTGLVLTALDYALRSRNVQDGQLIHHSDKGCKYTALPWCRDGPIQNGSHSLVCRAVAFVVAPLELPLIRLLPMP